VLFFIKEVKKKEKWMTDALDETQKTLGLTQNNLQMMMSLLPGKCEQCGYEKVSPQDLNQAIDKTLQHINKLNNNE